MSAIVFRDYMRISLRKKYQVLKDHRFAPSKYIGYLGGVLLVLVFFSGLSLAGDTKRSVHGNKALLPGGCGSCHKGHGVKGTPMLPASERDFCFLCHGDKNKQRGAMKARKLSQGRLIKNIENDFRKAYHHPIEKQGIHSSREVLPEKDTSTLRHVSCMDCHNPHKVKKDNMLAGVDGAKRGIQIKGNSKYSSASDVEEYEICYKCHSYSANLPADQKNKEEEFNPENFSYHPVETEGKNRNVPSLIMPLTTSSRIKCSDCHGSDGYNATKGTHGSIYAHILKKKYVESIRSAESRFNYELCYDCHSRDNLLANASWNKHKEHINITSCKTCHNSHGSKYNPYLIDFEPLAVFTNSEGFLEFRPFGENNFGCLLKCHDRDHVLVNSETKVLIPIKTRKK